MTPWNLLMLRRAVGYLRLARYHGRQGGATVANRKVSAAIKSMEGAVRHAERARWR